MCKGLQVRAQLKRFGAAINWLAPQGISRIELAEPLCRLMIVAVKRIQEGERRETSDEPVNNRIESDGSKCQ